MASSLFAFVSFKSPNIIYSSNDWFVVNEVHAGTAKPGASFSFSFNGTQVWLSGTIYPLQGNPPWVATFAVDGNTPVVLTGPDAPSQQFNTSFWASPQLADNQQHKIVVQVASATQNAPFLFDQLLYSPSNPSPTTTESAVVYASTTPPQVTVTVSAMPEAKAGAPVGAIVGGIVAGVVVLAVAGILVFYFWRRRQNDRPYHYNSVNSGDLSKGETSEGVALFEAKPYAGVALAASAYSESEPILQAQSHSSRGASTASPYSQSEYTQSTYASSSVHPASTPITNDFGAHQSSVSGTSSAAGSSSQNASYNIIPYQPRQSTSTSFPTPALAAAARPPPRSSPNQSMSKAAEAGILSVPPSTTYHADSGIRFSSHGQPSGSGEGPSGAAREDVVPTDVPPSYSES